MTKLVDDYPLCYTTLIFTSKLALAKVPVAIFSAVYSVLFPNLLKSRNLYSLAIYHTLNNLTKASQHKFTSIFCSWYQELYLTSFLIE